MSPNCEPSPARTTQERWRKQLIEALCAVRPRGPEELALIEELAGQTWSSVEQFRAEAILHANEERDRALLLAERRRAETEMALLRDTLEDRLTQRTAELAWASEQLREEWRERARVEAACVHLRQCLVTAEARLAEAQQQIDELDRQTRE